MLFSSNQLQSPVLRLVDSVPLSLAGVIPQKNVNSSWKSAATLYPGSDSISAGDAGQGNIRDEQIRCVRLITLDAQQWGTEDPYGVLLNWNFADRCVKAMKRTKSGTDD